MFEEALASLLPSLIFFIPGTLLAGLIAGLLGLGGGVVIVPLVFLLLRQLEVEPGLAISMAISTSLASIVFISIGSAYSHHSLGHVRWSIVKRWAMPIMLGSMLGSSLVFLLRAPWLAGVFGIYLMLIASASYLSPDAPNPSIVLWLSRSGTQKRIVMVIGFASALVGIGGGTMTAPLMRLIGEPIRQAIGTSAALGALIGVAATLVGLALDVGVLSTAGDASIGDQALAKPQGTYALIYLPGLLAVLPGTLMMAPLGAKLAAVVPERLLSKVFSVVLFFMGIKMLYEAL